MIGSLPNFTGGAAGSKSGALYNTQSFDSNAGGGKIVFGLDVPEWVYYAGAGAVALVFILGLKKKK